LETLDFYRLKFGIGKPKGMDPKDYVLSQLSDDELNKFKDSFKIALEGIQVMLKEGREKGITFINTYGRRMNDG
jgi:peptidyl-tRNA hydrolase